MPLKASIQRSLKRLGLYHRLTASSVYDAYWRIADPRVLEGREREVAFYRRVLKGLRKGDLVFDIGANQGYKTDIFLRLGATVVAVDPDDYNRKALEESFVRYRLAPKAVTIVRKAVSDRTAQATLWMDAPGSAKNTLNAEWAEHLRTDDRRFGHTLGFGASATVDTVTVEELISRYGVPFFVKIDVEGHELAVLRGLKRPVRYLSFEVNIPEFVPDGRRCLDRLHELAPGGEFNYAVDCEGDLAYGEWLQHREFRDRFDKIADKSIEVFWRT